MKVTMELLAGGRGERRVTKEEIQKNIDAVHRAIDSNKLAMDVGPLNGVLSILEGIKKNLPYR